VLARSLPRLRIRERTNRHARYPSFSHIAHAYSNMFLFPVLPFRFLAAFARSFQRSCFEIQHGSWIRAASRANGELASRVNAPIRNAPRLGSSPGDEGRATNPKYWHSSSRSRYLADVKFIARSIDSHCRASVFTRSVPLVLHE